MSGFLDDMARSSAERVLEAKKRESLLQLERRARAARRGAPLCLSSTGFDVIAELKLRSPAAGPLADADLDLAQRVSAYARGGAAAVSVLTEPTRFDGSLEHLRHAASVLAPFGIPVMRKDFLVDPYQVLEARAVGAGGVLVIVRMLTPERITELLDVAADHELFVLLEAFDAEDLEAAWPVLATRSRRETILIGVNSRDLQTLQVVQSRFAELAPLLPRQYPWVAESGVGTPDDARTMRRLGYRLALIGTALMNCDDPLVLLARMLTAGRTPEA